MKSYHATESGCTEKKVADKRFDEVVNAKLSKLETQLKAVKICEPTLASQVDQLLETIEDRPTNEIVKMVSSQLSFEYIITGAKPNRIFRIIKTTPEHMSHRVYIEEREDYGKN